MRRMKNAPIAIPTIAPLESPPLDFDEETEFGVDVELCAGGRVIVVPTVGAAVAVDHEAGKVWPSMTVTAWEAVGVGVAEGGLPEEVTISVVCVTDKTLVNSGKDTGACASARELISSPEAGGRISKKGL